MNRVEKRAHSGKKVDRASAVKSIPRLFAYFKGNLHLLILGVVFMSASSLLQIRASYLISPIIDTLVETGVDENFFGLVFSMVINVLMVVFVSYFANYSFGVLSVRTINTIRKEVYAHLQTLPVKYFDTHVDGEIMSTMTNDIDVLSQAIEQGIGQLLLSAITIVGTLAVMIFTNVQLTLAVVLIMLLMLVIVRKVGGLSAKYYVSSQAALAVANGYVEEMITGQRVVASYNYEDESIKRFGKLNENLRETMTKANSLGVVMMPITGAVSYIMYTAVALFGSILAIKGVMSYGNIGSFLQYTKNVSRPINMIAQQLASVFAALAGAGRIFELLDEDSETDEGTVMVVEKSDGIYYLLEDGNYKAVEGKIEFRDVVFGYGESDVLKGLEFSVKPGEKLAIVGPTGAGKTTISNLINRFYELKSGDILIDDISITRIRKQSLRSLISQVLQDVNLFELSVKDNVRLGDLNASDENVENALSLANATHFVAALPHGEDTVLTNNGEDLSRGERQMLAIARASLKNPAILILDEATSSVDTHTEKLINGGMDELMKGRTTLVIAHRLSTIRDADMIIVLDDGEIIESGNHEKLMKQKGVYYSMNSK